jgi:predicted RNA-binding protein with PIN domain
MSEHTIPSLLTLSADLVYRILDNMDDWTMLCSIQNVCTRIDTILATYDRYQVNFSLFFIFDVPYLQNITHSYNKYRTSVIFTEPE